MVSEGVTVIAHARVGKEEARPEGRIGQSKAKGRSGGRTAINGAERGRNCQGIQVSQPQPGVDAGHFKAQKL